MSEIKVNKISPRTNCGTVQLGDSGDTITIPAGATITNSGTATGFGATGAVNWQTTVKTGTFTATAGEGYFVDTTSGGFTVNLPAGTAGAVVGFKDYAGTFDTGNLTLNLNGSDKVGGNAVNPIISTEGIAVTLVFIDSTQGWLVTDSGLQSEVPGATYISATGGTVSTVCTNFKVHTFTGPGTFCVSSVGNPAGSNTVSYTVVAGGGGAGKAGGSKGAGGGGAGGFREGRTTTCSYTVSPLNAPAGLPVSVQGYPIVVGGGGAQLTNNPGDQNVKGNPGNTSSFSTISSAGGGGGGSANITGGNEPVYSPGINGGSGGGAGYECSGSPHAGGSGNTPSVSPAQGTDGGRTTAGPRGSAFNRNAGGGGGATTAGITGGADSPPYAPGGNSPAAYGGGPGGAGATTHITGSPVAYAGGGGGGGGAPPGNPWPNADVAGDGGTGGGGDGGPSTTKNGTAGTANTGGGGGGGTGGPSPANPGPQPYAIGAAGGSGIVIIRYRFQ